MASAGGNQSQEFEIVDGVRRAKAARMCGLATLPAQVDDGTGALGPIIDLPIDCLRSPKHSIDISTTPKFKRFKQTLDMTRQGLTPPPIIVVSGRRGTAISDVEFDL